MMISKKERETDLYNNALFLNSYNYWSQGSGGEWNYVMVDLEKEAGFSKRLDLHSYN